MMSIEIRHKRGGTCEVAGCIKPHYGRGMCKAHHQAAWKKGLLKSASGSLKDKIDHYSMPVTCSGCWIWIGSCNNKGYGTISVGGGKKQYAHRVAYSEYKGNIPDGYEVCHKCDTPACCNPDHLFIGSHKENMRDSVEKGRAWQCVRFGTTHGRAVLNEHQVSMIRNSDAPAIVIAKRLGVAAETIRRVRRRDSYIYD